MFSVFFKHFIIALPTLIFLSGIVGLILWRKNLVLILISLELCFIAANVGFVLTSLYIDDSLGFMFSMVSLTLAGAEVSLGLALTILVYRKLDTVFIKDFNKLRS